MAPDDHCGLLASQLTLQRDVFHLFQVFAPVKLLPCSLVALNSLVCTLVSVSVSGFSQEQESWPRFRGPNNDALSRSTGLVENWTDRPKLLWNVEGVGKGYGSISFSPELIFSTGNFEDGQSVVAFKRTTGERAWRKAITTKPPIHGFKGSRSTPTYSDGHVYVVGSDGRIVCLDASSGTVKWEKSFQKEWDGKMMTGWGFSESPLVDGDRVICTPGGPEAAVVALNKKTGEEIWKCPVGTIGNGKNHHGHRLMAGAGYSSVSISMACGVKQYVQLLGQGIVGIRASNGELLWASTEAASNIANTSTPLISDDLVFYSNAYGAGSELLRLTSTPDGIAAKQVYFLGPRDLQSFHGGMVLVDGYVYCGHKKSGGYPKCIELATGKSMWDDQRGEGSGSASVVYADGHVVFRYGDGKVALVEASPKKYMVKGSFKTEYCDGEGWAHPVVVDRKLYLREHDRLMCYDLAK